MADSTVVTGAPTNGDQSINAVSIPANNGSRRKSKSPRELYEMMYVGRVSSGEMKNLRIGESAQVPVKVVAYLKRRMDGAASRVASIKGQIGEYRQNIRNHSALSFTTSDVDAIRAKKLKAQADLIKAKDEYQMFKQFYEEALEANSVPVKHKIVAAREDAFAGRMAPSKAKIVIESLSAASKNGKATDIQQLKEIASGPRDAFREKCLELVQMLDGDLYVEIISRPKLLTKIIGRVADHYTSAKE